MNDNQLYANGRVAVLSTKLLAQDKLMRLAECNNVAEAVKVLTENGYGGMSIDNANDYETLLRAELDSALSVFKELCYDVNAVKFVLAKYDYLNAKALMKCKYMRVDGIAYCYNQGSISPEQMQSAIVADDYSAFSKNMAEALDAIDTAYANGKRSPQTVDVTLDKAMYKDLALYAKKCSFKPIRQLLDYKINTTNLMTLYRAKKARLTLEICQDLFIDGGSVPRETLLKLWDNEQAVIDLPSEYKAFYVLCSSDNETLTQAENERNSYVYKLIADNVDLMTIQPVLEYFLKKVNEIDRVRRIITGIKNGQDKDKLKDLIK